MFRNRILITAAIIIVLISSGIVFLLINRDYNPNTKPEQNGNKVTSINQITSSDYNYSMPKFSADGRTIYYISNESDDGYLQIWSMDLNGSNKKQITFCYRGIDTYDTSSDGKHIVFSKWDEIYVLDINNNNTMKLPQGWQPSFSLDGKKIIYISYTDLAGALMDSIDVIDVDGGNYSEIRGWFTFPIYNPIFNKDGSQIFYKVNNDERIIYPELYHSYIERLELTNNSNKIVISNADNITYFEIGPDNDCLIAVENGNLIEINISTSQIETILILDGNIDFFDIDYSGNRIVFSTDGEIWLGEYH